MTSLDLFTRTCIAGLIISFIAGPIGCIICWRRLAYFSDTMAHSSIFGISIALALGCSVYPTLIILYLLLALLLHYLSNNSKIGIDAILVFLSSTLLAAGLTLSKVLQQKSFNLTGLLFGDILSTTNNDLMLLIIMSIIISIILKLHWNHILSIAVNESLAHVEGINVNKYKIINTMLIAFFIGIAIKLVGLLLISALLIIPAISARNLSHSPLQMVIISTLLGSIGVSAGIFLSFSYDIPTGPSIVLCNSIIFVSTALIGRNLRYG